MNQAEKAKTSLDFTG